MSSATRGPEPRALTAQALAVGCMLGVFLTIANTYMSLKTGIWDGGFPTAAILAFAVLKALPFGPRGADLRGRTLVAQVVAGAAASMPAASGLLGAFPALDMLGRHVAPGWAVAWALALGAIGLVFALPLHRRLVDEEQLPFPTGRATARVIQAMHEATATGMRRARELAVAAGVTMVFVTVRDALRWIPGALFPPLSMAGVSAGSLTIGLGLSPMMLGVGAMIGPSVGIAMGLGGLLAWGGLAPLALRSREVATADFGALVVWLTWPGVGLMLAGAMAGLSVQIPTLLRALGGLRRSTRLPANTDRDERVPGAVVVVALAAVALMVVGWNAFHMHPLLTLPLVALSFVLAAVVARAAGETDFAPLGPMGQLVQMLTGPATHGAPVANIAAASIGAGAPAQSTFLIYMVSAGRPLGVALRTLFVAAAIGVVLGALASVPAYVIVTRGYGLGSESLPAPSARTWKAIAEVMTGSAAALPPTAAAAGWMAAAVGALLAVASQWKRARWLPSPVAMGVGFIIPAHYSIAIALGALLPTIARKLRPGLSDDSVTSVASGAIAGEALMGVVIALFATLGMRR